MEHWTENAIFYAIYPLGFCGAPLANASGSSAPVPRLEQIRAWLDHIQALGANALYLGPVFESSAHGYDTADYYWVDRRLGSNETLAQLSAALHRRGLRLVLDGVFNHVGRHFWAFRDVLENGPSSPYCDWFCNLNFDHRSPYNDPFSYEGWNGHYELVKLNLGNPLVHDHLMGAVESWIRQFDIDGLRLDAADCLDFGFMRQLAAFCRRLKPDFWLMGEVIHGDYRRWTNPELLDSVTNYECYKGLYSSHADRNYFEIAYALNRQSGPGGIYRDLRLYNFADNHDVDRVASKLADPAQLYPLYALLFTMPGIPSIYYGSEWGLPGKKLNNSDLPLRPRLDLAQLLQHSPQPDLPKTLGRLAAVRQSSPALRTGSYQPLWVASQQMAFLRTAGSEQVVVALNASNRPAEIELKLPVSGGLVDLLNPPERFSAPAGRCVLPLPPAWARILRVE